MSWTALLLSIFTEGNWRKKKKRIRGRSSRLGNYQYYLVVLGNDHASTSGEVEGDGGLVAAQVVDVEHDGLW